MFPPPKIVQDGEDTSPEGAELNIHEVSVANPVPVPETGVPGMPDVGVSVKVPTVPEVTAKVALAVSPAPPFVETTTV
jgi:hypothetical protein